MSKNIISWSEKYSVQVDIIDEQHKKLIGMLNDLFEAFMSRQQSGITSEIINRLVDYTHEHFSDEEKLMEKCGYADLEAHKAEHKIFIDRIKSFQNDYFNSKAGLTTKMVVFLQQWLKHHIMEVDKKYTDCVQKVV